MFDRSYLLVALCFALSGYAALIYETAWTREFAFVFGTSELAVATVLAAYMGGLAAGAVVGGRLADRITRPLLAYGILELGVAVFALLVPFAIDTATAFLRFAFGGQSDFATHSPLAISVFYLVATFTVVLLPTAFMGATLPLLSRHVVRHDDQIGPRIGLLYAINTLGAVAGTSMAAFVWLPALGIRQTVWLAVAVNVLVFFIAMLLVRGDDARAGAAKAPLTAPPPRRAAFHFMLPLMLVSGALSFAYEVLWVRLLSQLLGGSMYAFATMLGSFLAGIAIGSALASRVARTPRNAARAFVFAQVGVAITTAGAFAGIDLAPAFTRMLGAGAPLLVDVLLAALVLLPSAACIGATFPLAVRIVAPGAAAAGAASAQVYSWNTVGAILGSIGGAFFLLPELGFRGTIALGIGVNLLIAFAVALGTTESRPLRAAPVMAALLLSVLLPGDPWNVLRSSPLDRPAAPKTGDATFFAVGRGATVLVTEASPVSWRLSSNGLPESLVSSPNDAPASAETTELLGAIGPILRHEARSMLMIGLGGGVALEAVPETIDTVDVIEIEEEVVDANRWLAAHRARDPLADPRVRLHVNDARSALALSDKRFDVIAAQPSHPWTGGAAHLYTSEFFELASQRLEEGGVLVQWVGGEFVDLAMVQSMVATLAEHFAHVQVYRGLLFVASNDPLPLPDGDPGRSARERAGIHRPSDLAASLLIDEEGAREFAADAPLTRDDRNLLQMRAIRVWRAPAEERAALADAMNRRFGAFDPLPRWIDEGRLDAVAALQRLEAEGQRERAQRVAGALRAPGPRARLALLSRTRTPKEFAEALANEPGFEALRANALRRHPERAADFATSPEEMAFARALVGARRGEVNGSRDADLSRIEPSHPLYLDAVQLRVRWRVLSRQAGAAREAIQILDDAYRATRMNELLVLRAEAATAAREPKTALASLAQVNVPDAASEAAASIRGDYCRVLDSVPAPSELVTWRNWMRRHCNAEGASL